MIGGYLIVLAIVLVILIAIVVFVVQWVRSFVPYQRLTPTYPGIHYYLEEFQPYPVTPTLLVLCLHHVHQLLPQPGTRWSSEAVHDALKDVSLYVRNIPKWPAEPPDTGLVAGFQHGHVLTVGCDLRAFLHECAHRCEELIDGKKDYSHASWQDKGIYAADEVFLAWLNTVLPLNPT
jgi:hypothetical protein